MVLLGLTSCQSLDDINDRLDKVEVEVSDLKSAVKALQDAYGQAKIIRTVTPLEDGTHGWLITFTDNTQIKFVDGIVADVAKDEATGVITISLNDGRSFWFNTHYVCPTSIAILRTSPVTLSYGSRDTIEFRVNPSNASFKMSRDDCQIELDKVGEVKTRSSYVTTPSYYKLVGVEQVCDEITNEVKIGQYRAIIEDAQVCAEYNEMAALVMNVEDANGDKIQISSSAFEVKGHNYDNLPMTGLPVVIINTPNAAPIVSKEEWTDESLMTILNENLTIDFKGSLSVKGRGNSTWTFPKKPYALKLDTKSKILGMSKHKRFILLANFQDKTLIRNALAFDIARMTEGMDWAPNGRLVELIMNGEHRGNYYLCEQIKVDTQRVNISELDLHATSGEDITGGYVFEIDLRFDEKVEFMSNKKVPWMFKDPDDDINLEQFEYVRQYVNEMEEALYNQTKLSSHEYVNFIDLPSFVSFWLVTELTENYDAAVGRSVYMNKDKNGKMKAGPVWDFDTDTFGGRYYGNPYEIHFINENSETFLIGSYYAQLFKDELFVEELKRQWNNLYPALKNRLPEIINEYKELVGKSAESNFNIWSNFSAMPGNSDKYLSNSMAIDRMLEYTLGKIEYMNIFINELPHSLLK